jgi:hypothetical protein
VHSCLVVHFFFVFEKNKIKMPTLDEWKALFVEGLDYANTHATFFVPANRGLSKFQKLAVNTATDMNQLMTAVTLKNSAWLNSFDDPVAQEHARTNFKFGEGNTESYMVNGTFDDFAFVFCPLRVEVAPPAVVLQRFDDPSQGVVWNLFGGFGFRGRGQWTPFPFKWLQGGYSSTADGFKLSVKEGDMTVDCELRDRDWFSFSVEFGTTVLSGRVHALGPPLSMAKDGCFSCGKYGMKSTYYHRTDCDVEANLQLGSQFYKFSNGHGWIDHQSYCVTQARNFANNVIGNSVRVLFNQRKLSWLWMYIQDRETSTQYMLYKTIAPQKFKAGTVVYNVNCTVYKTDRVKRDVKGATLRVGKTVLDQDFNYPLEYHVTLPSAKQVTLKVVYGYGAHPNPTRLDSWEMPAVLLDSKNREIGSGLVELNGTTPDDVQAKRLVANLSPDAVRVLQRPLRK